MLVGGNMRVCRVKLMCGGFADVRCRFRKDVRLQFGMCKCRKKYTKGHRRCGERNLYWDVGCVGMYIEYK
jgi:hypothetical protein